jgi:hypothetical protein
MMAATRYANVEALAMQALSQPTMVAIDIDADAAPLPVEGVVTLVDFQRGLPLVGAPGWGKPVALRQPPAMLVAILSGSEGSDRLTRFLRWLREMGAMALPPVLNWRQGSEAGALEEVTRELGRLAAQGAARQAETARRADRLRADNQELRYRFALAESALQRRGKMPFTLAFESGPVAEHSSHDVLTECPAGLAQVLPTGSGGVVAVGLHFTPLGDPGASCLEVRLTSLEDARLIDFWAVDGRDLKAGWNLFALPRALMGQDRTLELQVRRNDGDDRLPLLGLGAGQPVPTFAIRDLSTGKPALPRSLALQVWRGLPGTALSASVEAHLPRNRSKGSLGGFIERPIAPAALTAVEHANSDAVSFDFRAVWAPPGENAATCHPPAHGLTLGRLPDASPAEAIRISASIAISNEKSHEVDFGMVVTDRAARALEILQGGSQPHAHEAFSGWTSLRSHEVKRLSAFCEGGRGNRSIFIATRMTKPGDNSYAQARFKDFSLMMRG